MKMIKFLDLKALHAPIQDELSEAVQRVVASGWYIGGEEVRQFEEDFASYLKVGHCIGCASGTDALELILRAFGIGPGDEVIVPAMTWVSDAEAVKLVGATPVFADVLENEYTIDPRSISGQITERTRAIIAVHLYGLPCRMTEIMELAKKRDIKVIEDCAHSHGATLGGMKTGGLGDAAALSFYPTKNLGALGDAGAVTTNDPAVAEKIRLLSDHGQPTRDKHVLIGKTSRLDPIQAAVLNVKLKYLDQWNEVRASNARHFLEALQDTGLKLPYVPEGVTHVYHQFVIQSKQRNRLRDYLLTQGIETAIHYPKALPDLPIYNCERYRAGDFPVSERLSQTALSLPILAEASMQNHLVKQIKDTIKHPDHNNPGV